MATARRYLLPSEVARRASPPVTPQTVKYWERRGLLPAAIRTGGGVRLFDDRRVTAFLAKRAERKGESVTK